MSALPSYRRVIVGLVALTGLSMSVVGVANGVTQAQRASVEQQGAQIKDLGVTLVVLSTAVNDQEMAVGEILIAGAPAAEPDYRNAVGAENAAIVHMQLVAAGLTTSDITISDLTTATRDWRTEYAEPAIALVTNGGNIAAFTQTNPDRHDLLDRLLGAVGGSIALADQDLASRASALATNQEIMNYFGLLVLLSATFLSVLLLWRYGRALERNARRANVVNRFTEVTSFAIDDRQVAAANLEAFALLVHPDNAVIHVLNRSKDRAVPEATLGTPIATVLPLNELSRCAGVVRGGMFVNHDLSEPLTVRCPVYPLSEGTLACIPLTSGEWVGAVHLQWVRPHMLPLDMYASLVRIVEHAALAIANRRLMAALQGQASTDARTGLANSRTFDQALDDALASSLPVETLAVLMLDIDRFKDFNDRFGHPAGDDALRTFARVLESCMRDGDLPARYGGEEFTVLLPKLDASQAMAVAERIRQRTESTVLTLGPGRSAHLNVTIGVATAPASSTSRIGLLRAADEALYLGKNAGRNRVQLAAQETIATKLPVPVLPIGAKAPVVPAGAA